MEVGKICMPGVKLKHFLKFNKDKSVISLSNVNYGFYGARYLNGEKELFNEKSGNIERPQYLYSFAL